jgi:hypothetical protein
MSRAIKTERLYRCCNKGKPVISLGRRMRIGEVRVGMIVATYVAGEPVEVEVLGLEDYQYGQPTWRVRRCDTGKVLPRGRMAASFHQYRNL